MLLYYTLLKHFMIWVIVWYCNFIFAEKCHKIFIKCIINEKKGIIAFLQQFHKGFNIGCKIKTTIHSGDALGTISIRLFSAPVSLPPTSMNNLECKLFIKTGVINHCCRGGAIQHDWIQALNTMVRPYPVLIGLEDIHIDRFTIKINWRVKPVEWFNYLALGYIIGNNWYRSFNNHHICLQNSSKTFDWKRIVLNCELISLISVNQKLTNSVLTMITKEKCKVHDKFCVHYHVEYRVYVG